jgi:hypothetical protein
MQPGIPRSSGEKADGEKAEISVTAIDITVTGTYPAVAEFLHSVTMMNGFIRPASLELSPQGSSTRAETVSAHCVCEALSFALPKTLEAMAEVSNAQQ